MRILVTLVIAIVFVASSTLFFINFSGPNNIATHAMQVAIVSGVVYVMWLISVAGKRSPPDSQLAINANLKQTLWLLALCIPGAFLFIGILAAPIIILISSVRLFVVLWKEQLWEYES